MSACADAATGKPCRDDIEEQVAEKMIGFARYSNVVAGAIMSVIIGAILLSLGMVVVDDFISIMPADGVFNKSTVTDPVQTAFGLGAIALIVPIVAAIVNLLLSAFGGFFGGNGGR